MSFCQENAPQWSESESFSVLNDALWSSVSSSRYAIPVNMDSSFEGTAFKSDSDNSGNYDLSLSVPCGMAKPT